MWLLIKTLFARVRNERVSNATPVENQAQTFDNDATAGGKDCWFHASALRSVSLDQNSYFPTRNYIICKFLGCPPATRRSTATLSLTNHYFDWIYVLQPKCLACDMSSPSLRSISKSCVFAVLPRCNHSPTHVLVALDQLIPKQPTNKNCICRWWWAIAALRRTLCPGRQCLPLFWVGK